MELSIWECVKTCAWYGTTISIWRIYAGYFKDISVDQFSDSTLYYTCEKFKLILKVRKCAGYKLITNNDESTWSEI